MLKDYNVIEGEEWTLIPIETPKYVKYFVSNLGRVMFNDSTRRRKHAILFDPVDQNINNRKTTFRVQLNSKGYPIHKLVYCCFNNINLDESQSIRFKDNNMFNVRLDNLFMIPSRCTYFKLGYDTIHVRLIFEGKYWVEMTDLSNGIDVYYVSDEGDIVKYIKDKDEVLTLVSSNDKISNIRIYDTDFPIDRLVICYFTNTLIHESRYIEHYDGNIYNNKLNNLLWGSITINTTTLESNHMPDYSRGNRTRMLNDSTVKYIRELYNKYNKNILFISKRTGVDHGTVRQIVINKTYKDVF